VAGAPLVASPAHRRHRFARTLAGAGVAPRSPPRLSRPGVAPDRAARFAGFELLCDGEPAGAAEVSVLAVELLLLRRSVAWRGTPGRRGSRGLPLNLPSRGPRGVLVLPKCPQFGWFLVLAASSKGGFRGCCFALLLGGFLGCCFAWLRGGFGVEQVRSRLAAASCCSSSLCRFCAVGVMA
jgi:hypothetical protein